MENLTILNKQTSVNAQEVILGNTVDYSWSVASEQQNPLTINFYVKRGIAGDEGFTGNQVIQGEYYPEGNGLNVRNSNFIPGDEALYLAILATCQGVCAGDPETSNKLNGKNDSK